MLLQRRISIYLYNGCGCLIPVVVTKYYREDTSTILFDKYFRCGTVAPGSTASEEIFDGHQTLETFLVNFVICRK